MEPDFTAMDLVALWPAFVGMVNPLVIAAITRVAWSPRRKSAAMFATVLVTTTVGLVIDGTLHPTSPRDWASALLMVFLITTTTYRHVWRPMGVAPAIERTVNPGPDGYRPRHAQPDEVVPDEVVPDPPVSAGA